MSIPDFSAFEFRRRASGRTPVPSWKIRSAHDTSDPAGKSGSSRSKRKLDPGPPSPGSRKKSVPQAPESLEAPPSPAQEPQKQQQKQQQQSETAVFTPTKKPADDAKPPAPTVYSFPPVTSAEPPPHTLILGTSPSPKSISGCEATLSPTDVQRRGGDGPQNFGNQRNIFWNIVGSALGFRRDRTPYQQQLRIFMDAGFALWDVVMSCERPGALDKDIVLNSIVPNDIPGFLERHRSVTRLVFHRTAADMFIKRQAFADWLEGADGATEHTSAFAAVTFVIVDSGPRAAPPETRQLFDKRRFRRVRVVSEAEKSALAAHTRCIELLVLPSTSPANARQRPAEKEMLWHRYAFMLDQPREDYRCPVPMPVPQAADERKWLHEMKQEYDTWRDQQRSMKQSERAAQEDDGFYWYR